MDGQIGRYPAQDLKNGTISDSLQAQDLPAHVSMFRAKLWRIKKRKVVGVKKAWVDICHVMLI